MILNTIKIKNIRSIKELELTFPESIILFFGDVGSGKSSVLKAIEFALFGTMGDLPAESLLRRGESRGSVELHFTLNGKPYSIYRELKKTIKQGKESITQSKKGWLIEDGTKTEYSASELRKKILNLLNYSTERYKSANRKCVDIYRYTVYTPQEEIKEILIAKPKDRFNILKDVLEIEKYEHVIANLEEIKKQLKDDLKTLKIKINNIGNPEEEIPEKKQEIETSSAKIQELAQAITNKKTELETLKGIKDMIDKDLNELSNKMGEMNALQEIIQKESQSHQQQESNLKKNDSKLKQTQEKLDALPLIELDEKVNKKDLTTQIEDLRKEEIALRQKETRLNNSIEQIEQLLADNKCPLCNQKIHEKERFEKELVDFRNNLKKVLQDLENIKKMLDDKKQLLEKVQKRYEIEIEKKNLTSLLHEQQEQHEILKNQVQSSKEKIEEAQKKMNEILVQYEISSFEELQSKEKEIKENLNKQNEKMNEVQEELTNLEREKSALEENIKHLNQELLILKENLKEKEKLLKRKAFKTEIHDWVSDQLPVLFRDIERNVLAATAQDFSNYFREWFAELVQDPNIELEVDPQNLQPTIYMNGHESPFRDMSGGEKSALSLAYRLALNQIINLKHPNVKTRDLLILDEPTDGFSEAQVNKMQEVFNKLNTKQLIIISHERTLDSFVSDIFNFTKTHHVTRVMRETKS